MSPLLGERELRLNEARARGKRWGESKSNEPYLWKRWPAMTDTDTNKEAHQRVADLLPLDNFGQELVLALYEAARDAYDARYNAQKAAEKARKKPEGG